MSLVGVQHGNVSEALSSAPSWRGTQRMVVIAAALPVVILY